MHDTVNYPIFLIHRMGVENLLSKERYYNVRWENIERQYFTMYGVASKI